MQNIPGICVAGGCILGALLEEPAGDVDIFITQHEVAEDALRTIYTAIHEKHVQKYGQKAKLCITRSRNAVTLHRCGSPKPPVQLITFTCRSTADLLLRFDVDCCAIAWEPQRGRVVATKRAQHAIKTQVNVANSAFETSGYTIRLEKYARRGFALFVPGLDLSLVCPDVINGSYVFFEDIEMLFSVKEMDVGPVEVWGGCMKATSIQRVIIVKAPRGSSV